MLPLCVCSGIIRDFREAFCETFVLDPVHVQFDSQTRVRLATLVSLTALQSKLQVNG